MSNHFSGGLKRVFGLAFLLALTGWLRAQEGIIVPISDEGQIVIDCDAGETIYFVDDNSGSTDFKIHTRTTTYHHPLPKRARRRRSGEFFVV